MMQPMSSTVGRAHRAARDARTKAKKRVDENRGLIGFQYGMCVYVIAVLIGFISVVPLSLFLPDVDVIMTSVHIENTRAGAAPGASSRAQTRSASSAAENEVLVVDGFSDSKLPVSFNKNSVPILIHELPIIESSKLIAALRDAAETDLGNIIPIQVLKTVIGNIGEIRGTYYDHDSLRSSYFLMWFKKVIYFFLVFVHLLSKALTTNYIYYLLFRDVHEIEVEPEEEDEAEQEPTASTNACGSLLIMSMSSLQLGRLTRMNFSYGNGFGDKVRKSLCWKCIGGISSCFSVMLDQCAQTGNEIKRLRKSPILKTWYFRCVASVAALLSLQTLLAILAPNAIRVESSVELYYRDYLSWLLFTILYPISVPRGIECLSANARSKVFFVTTIVIACLNPVIILILKNSDELSDMSNGSSAKAADALFVLNICLGGVVGLLFVYRGFIMSNILQSFKNLATRCCQRRSQLESESKDESGLLSNADSSFVVCFVALMALGPGALVRIFESVAWTTEGFIGVVLWYVYICTFECLIIAAALQAVGSVSQGMALVLPIGLIQDVFGTIIVMRLVPFSDEYFLSIAMVPVFELYRDTCLHRHMAMVQEFYMEWYQSKKGIVSKDSSLSHSDMQNQSGNFRGFTDRNDTVASNNPSHRQSRKTGSNGVSRISSGNEKSLVGGLAGSDSGGQRDSAIDMSARAGSAMGDTAEEEASYGEEEESSEFFTESSELCAEESLDDWWNWPDADGGVVPETVVGSGPASDKECFKEEGGNKRASVSNRLSSSKPLAIPGSMTKMASSTSMNRGSVAMFRGSGIVELVAAAVSTISGGGIHNSPSIRNSASIQNGGYLQKLASLRNSGSIQNGGSIQTSTSRNNRASMGKRASIGKRASTGGRRSVEEDAKRRSVMNVIQNVQMALGKTDAGKTDGKVGANEQRRASGDRRASTHGRRGSSRAERRASRDERRASRILEQRAKNAVDGTVPMKKRSKNPHSGEPSLARSGSKDPSKSPSKILSKSASKDPSKIPSKDPSRKPSNGPSRKPSKEDSFANEDAPGMCRKPEAVSTFTKKSDHGLMFGPSRRSLEAEKEGSRSQLNAAMATGSVVPTSLSSNAIRAIGTSPGPNPVLVRPDPNPVLGQKTGVNEDLPSRSSVISKMAVQSVPEDALLTAQSVSDTNPPMQTSSMMIRDSVFSSGSGVFKMLLGTSRTALMFPSRKVGSIGETNVEITNHTAEMRKASASIGLPMPVRAVSTLDVPAGVRARRQSDLCIDFGLAVEKKASHCSRSGSSKEKPTADGPKVSAKGDRLSVSSDVSKHTSSSSVAGSTALRAENPRLKHGRDSYLGNLNSAILDTKEMNSSMGKGVGSSRVSKRITPRKISYIGYYDGIVFLYNVQNVYTEMIACIYFSTILLTEILFCDILFPRPSAEFTGERTPVGDGYFFHTDSSEQFYLDPPITIFSSSEERLKALCAFLLFALMQGLEGWIAVWINRIFLFQKAELEKSDDDAGAQQQKRRKSMIRRKSTFESSGSNHGSVHGKLRSSTGSKFGDTSNLTSPRRSQDITSPRRSQDISEVTPLPISKTSTAKKGRASSVVECWDESTAVPPSKRPSSVMGGLTSGVNSGRNSGIASKTLNKIVKSDDRRDSEMTLPGEISDEETKNWEDTIRKATENTEGDHASRNGSTVIYAFDHNPLTSVFGKTADCTPVFGNRNEQGLDAVEGDHSTPPKKEDIHFDMENVFQSMAMERLQRSSEMAGSAVLSPGSTRARGSVLAGGAGVGCNFFKQGSGPLTQGVAGENTGNKDSTKDDYSKRNTANAAAISAAIVAFQKGGRTGRRSSTTDPNLVLKNTAIEEEIFQPNFSRRMQKGQTVMANHNRILKAAATSSSESEPDGANVIKGKRSGVSINTMGTGSTEKAVGAGSVVDANSCIKPLAKTTSQQIAELLKEREKRKSIAMTAEKSAELDATLKSTGKKSSGFFRNRGRFVSSSGNASKKLANLKAERIARLIQISKDKKLIMQAMVSIERKHFQKYSTYFAFGLIYILLDALLYSNYLFRIHEV